MAEQQNDTPNIFSLGTQPGVQRDGTNFDKRRYSNGVWTRFQRGRPRKMGGYVLMSDQTLGPVRNVRVDARSTENNAHLFSPWGIDRLSFDGSGIGGGIVSRTPSGFVGNLGYTWQSDTMFSSTGSAGVIVAAATPDALNIAENTAGPIYVGDQSTTGLFTQISDTVGPILVSGGICVLQPFLFVYGSNGLIRNCDVNNFQPAGWTVGGGSFANSANVAGSKIVCGLPTRGGGRSPAGLFWSLDSLIRVSFINSGSVIWQYDTVSAAISILSKNSVIEVDGVYFWPGVDRFYAYSGVVQELPNDFNSNFFFDNINFTHRNKVWVAKNNRFGEIWWFFPRGESTECNHALIYNFREKIWYDTELSRSAGAAAEAFFRPIFAGGDLRVTVAVPVSGVAGAFATNQTLTGVTSGAVGVLRRVTDTILNVEIISGAFVPAETVQVGGGAVASATVSGATTAQSLDSVWLHEQGRDRVYKSEVTAIRASIETDRFTWMSGGPSNDTPAGPDVQTRITRVEPDFLMEGDMNVYVSGAGYAAEASEVSSAYPITPTTAFISIREQRREMSLIFESNVVGGHYETGRILVQAEPGDERG